MVKKPHQLDHHHNLGILLLILMLSTIPLFIWALNQSSQTTIRAYYPDRCQVPKIPRTKVCSTKWSITRDENGCRVFVCEDNPTP